MLRILDRWRAAVENWPWLGILLSILFLAAIFSLSCWLPQQTSQEAVSQNGASIQCTNGSADSNKNCPRKPPSVSEKIHSDAKDCTAYQADEHAYSDCLIAHYTEGVANYTAALVIATILLFLVGVYQSIKLRRSVIDAELSSKRQSADMQEAIKAANDANEIAMKTLQSADESHAKTQRAYVCFAPPSSEQVRHIDDNGVVSFYNLMHVNWENVGSTPAIKLAYFTEKHFVDVGETLQYDTFEIADGDRVSTIGPHTVVPCAQISITADQGQAVYEKKKRFIVRAGVVYCDIFSTLTRRSQTIIELTIQGDPKKVAGPVLSRWDTIEPTLNFMT